MAVPCAEPEPEGATAKAAFFAQQLARILSRAPASLDRRQLCGVIGAYAPSTSAPLEQSVCNAALGAATPAEAARAALSYAEEHVSSAGSRASAAAAAYLAEKCGEAPLALAGGSALTAAACAGAKAAEVRLIGDGAAAALRLRDTRVRQGPLASAAELLRGAGALLLGAHEVAHNGAVLVDAGVGAVAYVARRLAVPVLVVTQATKFTDRVIVVAVLDELDVLQADDVQLLITDVLTIPPARAPDVLKHVSGAQ